MSKEIHRILVIGASLALVSHAINGKEARSEGVDKDYIVVASSDDEIHLMLSQAKTLADMTPFPIRPKVDRIEITGDTIKVARKVGDHEELRTYKVRVEGGQQAKPRGASAREPASKAQASADPDTGGEAEKGADI